MMHWLFLFISMRKHQDDIGNIHAVQKNTHKGSSLQDLEEVQLGPGSAGSFGPQSVTSI